jgi:hypothetical protein
MAKDEAAPDKGGILIYQAQGGQTKIEVQLEGQTLWLTQAGLAELYQTTKQNVSLHIQNIYEESELHEDSTVKEYLTVQIEGGRQVSRQVKHYNLDMIISIGYRVKSQIATHFRQWATEQLREYIVKGFVLNDERLKNPDHPFDYFDELLRRIQDIRTSERRFYQKITDIYTTSVDYDPTSETSINFFKTVQNKMHWAITGMTAAEIIHDRADASKPNMGLSNWRGEKVRKGDIVIAKNYLEGDELSALNNLVEQYLVFAEGQAMRRVKMYMKSWVEKLNGFLSLNDRDILKDAGRISHDMAKKLAETQYDEFNKKRIEWTDKQDSDFDKTVKMIEAEKKKLPKKDESDG